MKKVKHLAKSEEKVKKGEIERLQNLHTAFEEKVDERIKVLRSDLSAERLQKRELHESEELFRTTFDHAAIGIAHVRLEDGRWIRVNKRFCEIAGWSEKELLKQTFLDTTHPDDHKRDLELIGGILEGKVSSINMEKRYVRKDGSNRWVYATASIIRDASGKPKYGIAIVEDIHEKKQAEEMLKILAESSKLLAQSLDYRKTLSSVADLVVPHFADWCIIDLLGENNEYKRVKVAYHGQKNKKIADKLYKYPPKHGSSTPIERSIRLGKSILAENITPEMFAQYTYEREQLKAILGMKHKSFMSVPLIARGKTIGAISFRSTQPSRRYSKEDLFFAEQIANRIALAVDNARLYEQAQKAVAVRDDFLGIASHELKTSLTTVKALTQILQKDFKESKKKYHTGLLSKMDAQLNKTTKLINDLLDVSKINSGKITVRKEWLEIANVVEEVVENCRRLCDKHEIVLEIGARENVYADKDRIGQVITNLIVNALKYSSEAEKVIVKVQKDGKNILISVQDFGIGIVEKNKTKIFDRFFRANTQVKDRVAGVGLGLYISRKLIEQHDGLIWVESKVGKGSTFYVCLPYGRDEKAIKPTPSRLLRMAIS